MRLYEHLLGEVKPVNDDNCEKVYDQFDCYVTTVTQPIVIVRDDSDGLSLRKLVIAVLTLLLVGCSALLFVMTIYQAEMHSSNPVEEILLRENYPREDFAYIDQFIDFMNEYGRKYHGYHETRERFQNFVNNMKYIKKIQQGKQNVQFGITRFADWSEEEMKSMTCGEEPNMEMRYDREYYDGSYEDEFTLYDGFGGRPESFDWRSKNVVTDIKDQQRCGSCWAFGAVGVVESMNAIAKNPLVSLSEQQLVDCDMNDNGCDGGYRPYALQYIRHNGIVPEELYPYAGKELDSCKLNTTVQRVYVKTVKYIRRNESAMADFVFYKGPLSVGINVTKDLFHYQSGVFTPSKEDCEQNPQGTHALAVVGYGSQNGEDYWIIKNSWGKRWGMDGFFLYKRGANSCGIADSPCSVEA